jgi:hypothetical protein
MITLGHVADLYRDVYIAAALFLRSPTFWEEFSERFAKVEESIRWELGIEAEIDVMRMPPQLVLTPIARQKFHGLRSWLWQRHAVFAGI